MSSSPPEVLRDIDTSPCKKSIWTRFMTERPGVWVLPLLAVCSVAAMYIVVGPLFFNYYRSASVADGKQGAQQFFLRGNATQYKCPCDTDDVTHLRLQLDVTQLQAAQVSVRVVVDFNAYGGLVGSSAASTLDLDAHQSLVVWFGKQKQVYGRGDVLGKQESTLLLGYSGSRRHYTFYPFDEYVAQAVCAAYIQTNAPDGSALSVAPVPICASFTSHLSTFHCSSSHSYAADIPSDAIPGSTSLVVRHLKFSRTSATKFFSIFIVILMWALSSSQLVLCIDHLFLRPREPLAPTVGFSITLLFALPAVRNTQPEVPPIGAAVDAVGFFWNMAIVALSACMFMAAFTGFYKHTPMKK